jgi:hypothetical protein
MSTPGFAWIAVKAPASSVFDQVRLPFKAEKVIVRLKWLATPLLGRFYSGWRNNRVLWRRGIMK